MRTLSRLLALCLPVVVLASGCTDERTEPPPPPADTSETQLRDGLSALWTGDNPTTEDTAAADCFAREFLDRPTIDQLRTTGIITEAEAVVTALPILDPELAGIWVDAQFACVSYIEGSTRAVSAQSRGTLNEEAYAACLREDLTDDQIRTALVSGLSGNPDAAALDVLSQAQAECARSAT